MIIKLLLKIFRKSGTKNISGENSIAESRFIDINGLPQWILIRGKRKDNPIILILHGGPGMVCTGMTSGYQNKLEENFIVVHWHYRGAGKSFNSKISASTMTLEQVIDDGEKVSSFLLEKFSQQKLHLLGFSWGTVIGLKLVQKSPHLFHSITSVGQLTDIIKMEKLSLAFLKEKAKVNSDIKILKEIDQMPEINSNFAIKSFLRKQEMIHKYGGNFAKGGPINDLIAILMVSPNEHSFKDVLKCFRGLKFSMTCLFSKTLELNLFEEIQTINVPIYFITGENDCVAMTELIKTFYDKIDTPKKLFLTIKNTAHFPHFSEPEAFQNLVISTLKDQQ